MKKKSNTGNVIRLAAAQALSMTTMNVNIINTALVGSLLSPVPWLATLGLSLQFLTSMLTTFASITLNGAIWPQVDIYVRRVDSGSSYIHQGISILLMNFPLFCMASMCLGIAQGCAGFYRYAAADSAVESQKPRAISYVLAGGLLAAFLDQKLLVIRLNLCPVTYMQGVFSVYHWCSLCRSFLLAE